MCSPDLYHLPDGREICQICIEIKTRDELEPVAGDPTRVWNVCKACVAVERSRGVSNWD